MLRALTPCWRFQCLECGFSDQEVGHLVEPDEVYCIVCLETEGRHARLQRWEDSEYSPNPARNPPPWWSRSVAA